MSVAYDKNLRQIAKTEADKLNIPLKRAYTATLAVLAMKPLLKYAWRA